MKTGKLTLLVLIAALAGMVIGVTQTGPAEAQAPPQAHAACPALADLIQTQIGLLKDDSTDYEELAIYVEGRENAFSFGSGCPMQVDRARGVLIVCDEGKKGVPQYVVPLGRIIASSLWTED